MFSTKTIFTIFLAVALLAGGASAQTSPTEDAEGPAATSVELIESQERLIKQQQLLIDNQEALLNAYRCLFKVDTEVVSGGCPGQAPGESELSEAEVADGALLCAGWRAEAEETQRVLGRWESAAIGLAGGFIDIDHTAFEQLIEKADGYHDRVSAISPNLQSERFQGLMGAMADAIKAVQDTYADGGPADKMVAAINAGIDRLNDLDSALREICN